MNIHYKLQTFIKSKVLLSLLFSLLCLTIFSSQAVAEENSCEAYFSHGLQSNSGGGSIDFLLNAQTLENPNNSLETKRLSHFWFSWEKTCGASNCSKTGKETNKITLPEFQESNSNQNINLAAYESREIGVAEAELNDVYLAYGSVLNFSHVQQTYKIKNLKLEWGANLVLSSGDYWIENLNIMGVSQISVEGAGQARIFIKKDFSILGASQLNHEGSPEQLTLIGYSDIDLGILTETNAMVYAKKMARVGALSIHRGSISAKNVLMGISAKNYFDADAAELLFLPGICGESSGEPDLDGDGIPDSEDLDIDGDGFSNDDEIAAGTDPRDANSFPDIIAPIILLNNTNPESIENEFITLTGTVNDSSASEIEFTITNEQNNVLYPVDLQASLFELAVPVIFGENIFTLTASDEAGNESELTSIVFRVDETAPELLVTTQSEQNIESPNIEIIGTAFDINFGKGLDKVEITNDRYPNLSVTANLNNENFSGLIDLAFGLNIIQVKAIDLAGLETIQAISITRVDLTPPVIVMASPQNNSQLEAASVSVSGLVNDNVNGSGLAQVHISNSQFPNITYPVVINNVAFTSNIPLNFGAATITVIAQDLSGNTSQVSVLVNRVDLTAPVLTITTQTQNLEQTNLLIEGTVEDNVNGIGIERIEITNNRNSELIDANLTLNNFSGSVNLAFGENIISVKAVDLAGNESTASIIITRIDNTPPILSITTTAGEINTPIINISGVVQDNVNGQGIDKIEITNNQNTDIILANLSGNHYNANINLSFGENVINVSAYDFAGNSVSAQIIITRIDNITPTLTINTLPAEIEAPTITLSGTIFDNEFGVGIDRVEGISSASPEIFVASLVGNTYQITLPLNFAENTLSITAYDLATNQTNQSVNVNRVDLTAPSLSPNAIASETEDTSIVLSGSVTDNENGIGIDRVEINDGSTTHLATLTESNGNILYSLSLPLNFGANHFSITVFDLSANSSSNSQSINRVDLTPPVLTLDSFANETDAISILLSGTATDNANGQGVDRVEIIDTNNNLIPTTLNGNQFSVNLNLHFGANSFIIKAYDLAGNVSETNATINRIDQTPPTLSLNNPASQIVSAANVTVSGIVFDDVNGMGIDKVELTNATQIISATINDTSFNALVPLTINTNTITIVAYDLAGNTSTASIQVIRPDQDGDGIPDDIDTDRDGDGFDNNNEIALATNPDDANDYPDIIAPTITITTPSQTIEATQISIIGSASDDGGARAEILSITASSNRYANIPFAVDINASNPATANWSSSLPLKLGDNLITFTIVDAFGNSANASVNIKRVSPPRFVNLTPTNGAVIQTPTITIAGQVTTDQPLTSLSFFVNEWQITPSGSQTAGLYPFEIDNIPLEIGMNTFVLRTISVDGSATQTLNLTYIPANADSIPAPSLTLLAPNSGALLSDASFQIVGQVESFAGKVNVTVNGELVTLANDYQSHFKHLISFPENTNSLTVNISATDQLGKTTNINATYYRDNTFPTLHLINLSESPAINPVVESPQIFTGYVSDNNLASVTVNEQSLFLKPSAVPGEYTFDLSVSLSAGEQKNLEFIARDISGNKTNKNYTLQSTASANIHVLTPSLNSQFISDNEPLSIEVIARITGFTVNDQAKVSISNEGGVLGEETQLTVENANAALAVGQITLPSESGNYLLNFTVSNSLAEIIASTSLPVNVLNSNDVPLELVRFEPESLATNEEVTRSIELYFNKAIDQSKLQVLVKENFQGLTYINQDELGEAAMFAKGYKLDNVIRVNEEVPGALSLLPGNTQVTYSTTRAFAYGAELNVEVIYDGNSLASFAFNTRQLPTFIDGYVKDGFGQPVEGAEVALPELGRTSITDKEGRFGFGYAETPDKLIPGGTYRYEVNKNMKLPFFGAYLGRVEITENRRNQIAPIILQEMRKDLPYYFVAGGQANNSLAEGNLLLNLENASTYFPNGEVSGGVHSQVLAIEHFTTRVQGPFTMMWMFANQPRGIRVAGNIELNMFVPELRSGIDYLGDTKYVALLAYDNDIDLMKLVGVGEIVNKRVISRTPIEVNSLDYFGYSLLPVELAGVLEAVVNGERNLLEIEIEMEKLLQANQSALRSNP